jgi:hypothetical protein
MPRCAASSVAGPQCEAEIVQCNWASGSPRERRGRTTGVLLSRCPRSSREPSRCGSGGAGSLLATARSPSLTVTTPARRGVGTPAPSARTRLGSLLSVTDANLSLSTKRGRDPPAWSAGGRRGWSRIVHGLPSKWHPAMTFPGSSVAVKGPLTSENAAGSPTQRHAPSTINAT